MVAFTSFWPAPWFRRRTAFRSAFRRGWRPANSSTAHRTWQAVARPVAMARGMRNKPPHCRQDLAPIRRSGRDSNARDVAHVMVVPAFRLAGSCRWLPVVGCRSVDSASAVEDNRPGEAHMQGIGANPGPLAAMVHRTRAAFVPATGQSEPAPRPSRPQRDARRQRDRRDMEVHPIGVIRTPYRELAGMPIQPSGAAGVKGTVEVMPEYARGLQDLDGFSHIILIYLFDRSAGYELQVVPFLDTSLRGLFSTRAPRRPNPIGLSVVKLERITGRVLHVDGVDILDDTPLLDIKPYVPAFDAPRDCETGWLANVDDTAREKRSDGRFE